MLEFSLQGINDSDNAGSIGRCLRNLYSTPAGSIPCDRDFGLSWAGLDFIPSEMEAVYSLELIEKTDRYEPRVKAVGVEFHYLDNGETVQVKVELEPGGGSSFG